MKEEEFDRIIKMITSIKGGLLKKKMYDEHGDTCFIGFENNNQFNVLGFRTNIYLINYISVVSSNSVMVDTDGCKPYNTFFRVGDDYFFEEYFIRYLNKHTEGILRWIINEAENDLMSRKEDKIKRLENEIKKIRAIGESEEGINIGGA